jgi:nitrate/nitrite-specific signal transduction histidine kinase
MAAQLKALYSDLESRVEEKTRQLGLQNKELAILYEFSAYLSQSGELEQRCNGFLTRLIEHFGAKGGTVRILDSRQHNLHLTVHQGISEQFAKDELCLHAGDCLCGEAAQKGVMQLHDFRHIVRKKVSIPLRLHKLSLGMGNIWGATRFILKIRESSLQKIENYSRRLVNIWPLQLKINAYSHVPDNSPLRKNEILSLRVYMTLLHKV